jgi:hypothetical protein
MISRTWTAVPFAGLLAVAASGCAGSKHETVAASDPYSRRVEAQQQDAQAALQNAHEAQDKANVQGQKAFQAQAVVQQKQQELVQKQQILSEEQAKALQTQDLANQKTKVAAAEAKRAQTLAAAGLAQQSQQLARGQQTLAGRVVQSSSTALVVMPPNGTSMTFRVSEKTKYQVDGKQANASDIQQGEDARVVYDVSGTEPSATFVQVMSGTLPPGAPQGAKPSQPAAPSTQEQTGAPSTGSSSSDQQ